jgi:hypothetical protein
MSQAANIVVFDGAPTPVQHTLVSVSVSKEKGKVTAFYREASAAVPTVAQINATITMQQAEKSGVYRVDTRVVVPVMESISGQNAAGYTAAPKVAYENTVILTGYFHERSDVAGRRLVRQLALNIGGNIATSVAPVTAGPIPELFDLLVSPT